MNQLAQLALKLYRLNLAHEHVVVAYELMQEIGQEPAKIAAHLSVPSRDLYFAIDQLSDQIDSCLAVAGIYNGLMEIKFRHGNQIITLTKGDSMWDVDVHHMTPPTATKAIAKFPKKG